jgi:hypothetical protein
MDPVAITVELELGSLIVAAVAAIATFIHHRHQDKPARPAGDRTGLPDRDAEGQPSPSGR